MHRYYDSSPSKKYRDWFAPAFRSAGVPFASSTYRTRRKTCKISFLHPFPKLFLGAAKNLRVCYGAILIVDGIIMRYALGCDWRRCSPTTLPRSHHLLLHLPLVHASLRRRQRPPVHTSVGTRRHACSLTIIQSRLVPADPLQRKPKRRPTELWPLCDVTLPGAQGDRPLGYFHPNSRKPQTWLLHCLQWPSHGKVVFPALLDVVLYCQC